TQGLAADDRLRTALRGLSGAMPPESTWEPFQPTGGTVDVDFRVAHAVDMHYAAVEVDVALHGVTITWTDLPLPSTPERARVSFRSDGRTERGLGFVFSGPLRTAQRLTLAGRMQTDTAR